MVRRVGLSQEFMESDIQLSYPVSWPVPTEWAGRGRWKSGAMHTFVDDYRQEFFWRRPEEGLLVAMHAAICTAPDFTAYTNDPLPWRKYQAWRSAAVAAYWARHGVQVIPVVSFGTFIERYCQKGSTWAVRSPGKSLDESRWLRDIETFLLRSDAARLVVFGRYVNGLSQMGIPVENRLLNRRTHDAHQSEMRLN